MSENFKIDDDFEMYEQQNRGAAEEAGKAEKRSMGVNMPLGTEGTAVIIGLVTGKSKVKTDASTKQRTGGNPMITITTAVKTPSDYIGQKNLLFFTMNATDKQTVQDKWQRFYDTMMDLGMPEDLRGKPVSQIVAWAAEKEREFRFEVKPHWDGKPGNKEFKPQGAAGSAPLSTDLNSEMPTFSIGDSVNCSGNPATVKEIMADGQIKISITANGAEMIVPSASITK